MTRFLIFILVFCAASSTRADDSCLWLPNLPGCASGTASGGHNGIDVNISGGTVTATNPSVGLTGSAVPTSATYTGFINGTGNLTAAKVNASQALTVDGSAVTQPVSAASLPLPAGASTSALQSSGNASLASILAALPSGIGQTTMAGSLSVVVASNQTVPVSAVALPLPSGAATSALQTTGNTTLTTINTTLGSPFQAGGSIGNASFGISGTLPAFAAIPAFKIDQTTPGTTNGVQVNAAIPAGSNIIGKVSIDQTTPGTTNLVSIGTNGTVAINAAIPAGTNVIGKVSIDQTTPGTTNLVSIGTNGTVQTKAPLNSTGSGSAAAATVSTVITLTAPANAVKAYLMNLDTSTANIRWAVNRTATTTLGQQLQPGRDVVIETSHDISLVSESGTQTYDVQWISQ